MSSQSRRRLIWGALSVLGAIALVSVLAVLTSTHDDTVVTPGLGITGAPAIDAGESAGPIAGKPVDRGNADVSADASAQLAVDAAVVIAAGEKARMLGVCTQREATQDWQALRECAEGLDKLGVTDEAAAFKAQAVKEQDNEGKANTVRQLIRDHNLKEAQALLAKIGDGSVYYKQLSDALREKAVMEGKANTVLELIRDHKLEEAQTLLAKIGDGSVYYRQLSEAFTKAENAEIDSAVRRAQAFASAHDCAAFRAQQKQLVQSSTARVAGAIAPIKCTEKVAQTESARGNSPSVASANPVGGATVVPTPPAAAVTWPAVSGPCAQNAVDEALELAAHQYSSGYAKAALSQVLKALACKQEIRMFRIAAMYACGAKDLATAKLYVTKLPPYQQGAIVQRCQQEGLDIRQP
jgi:hypothetical protein